MRLALADWIRRGLTQNGGRGHSQRNAQLGQRHRNGRLRCRGGHRQLERKGRADADGAFDANSALVGLDDFAAHREAHAGAPFAAGVWALLGRVEAIEDSRQAIGRDAAARVAHRQVDRVGCRDRVRCG